MPDWKQIARHKLATLNLSATEKEEVIAELASHFEDGASEPHASDDASDLNSRGWRKLAYAIQRAKGEHAMNRTKTLWIPVFVNLMLSSVVIDICNWLGWIDVRITQPGALSHALQPWLLALPFCGATAAFLAWRSQGSRVTRILAALAPSLVWLASIPVVKLILICFPNVFA